MIHYTSDFNDPQEICKDEFHELYRVDYNEQETEIPFESAHCMIDPYYEEICHKTKPLVGRTLEQLKDLYRQSCEEI